MKKRIVLAAAALAALVLALETRAAVYRVGEGREFTRLRQIVNRLEPGDVVEIDPGVYREVMIVRSKGTAEAPIVIRGAGGQRPVFDAEGLEVSGRGPAPRAVFQIEGGHTAIEGLEIKNARNGNNGAGIRLNNPQTTVIRDCHIHHNDMGIQGGGPETIVVENCDIGFNGSPEHNGYSHNFYMTGNRVTVRNCYIHDSVHGQNYKSRAHYNELWFNWIVDSNEGEVGPVDGEGQTDRPHSNTLMAGNVIASKPNRTGNSAKYVIMGSELGGSRDGTLYMYFNVMIAGSPRVKFIQLDDPLTNLTARYNVFYGSDQILAVQRGGETVIGECNWIPGGAEVPPAFENTLRGERPPFEDAANRDFRWRGDSPFEACRPFTLEYRDGEGQPRTFEMDFEALQRVRGNYPGAADAAVGGYERQ